MSEWGRRDFLMASMAAALPKYRIIDPHVHVWKHDPKYPWAKETTHPPEGDATPEMLLALMKQHGVEKTVLIQYIGYRWDNRFVADALKQYPQELEKLIALARYPKVFVKISHTWSISKQPYPYLDAQEFVKRLYAKFGPQRLMWATDWPIVERVASYTKALTVVRDEMKFLNDDDRRWILFRTVTSVPNLVVDANP